MVSRIFYLNFWIFFFPLVVSAMILKTKLKGFAAHS